MDNETAQFLIEAFRAQDIQTQKKLDRMILQNQDIIAQTTKTNGRVTRLEQRADKCEKEVDLLSTNSSETKGRDRVIYYFIGGLAIVSWYLIQNALIIKIK